MNLNKLSPSAITSLVTLIVGLAVTNGLITNENGKVITGVGSVLVALGFLVYGAVSKHAHAKVKVAEIRAATDAALYAPVVAPAPSHDTFA